MILIVSPASEGSLVGNEVTTHRWVTILNRLGHETTRARVYVDGRYDMLVALHARKSAEPVLRFRSAHPAAPIVLALTGTDLYPDLRSTGVDPAVLAAADRIVVLQENALGQLDKRLRPRARVIVQSMPPVEGPLPDPAHFDVALLAHLRDVKDPLRLAVASRLLPPHSRIRIVHAGEDLDPELGALARAESGSNPRYEWIGPVPRVEALRLLAGSRLFVLSSWHEGGANVISEALAADVPILASAIPGSIGLLGPEYPGYFPPGDTTALADLLLAAEQDVTFYRRLREHCARARPLVEPDRERNAWSSLLHELSLLPSRS